MPRQRMQFGQPSGTSPFTMRRQLPDVSSAASTAAPSWAVAHAAGYNLAVADAAWPEYTGFR